MRHGSLFSGIGGFDLAAEWMGWENVFHCEFNPFCQKILKHYWPDAKSYGDIKETDFTEWRGKVDIVSGGFPCQPYSQAGKRKGKADDRHLWPEMLRAIREIRPSWIVGENVPGLLNWERGVVLDEIKADLEAAGFEVFPPLILPACGKNAPHRRDRLWIVGYSSSNRRQRGGQEIENENRETGSGQRRKLEGGFEGLCSIGFITDTFSNGGQINGISVGQETGKNKKQIRGDIFYATEPIKQEGIITNPERIGQQGQGRPEGQGNPKTNGNWKASWSYTDGRWPTVSPIRGRDDGLSSKLVKQCLEALGNAIVPQVAYEIFKAIKKTNYDILSTFPA